MKRPFPLFALMVLSLVHTAFADVANTTTTTSSETTIRRRTESPLSAGLDLQYSPFQYKNYAWTDNQTVTNFGHGLRIGLEWLPFGDRVGKLGLGIGSGFFFQRNVYLGKAKFGNLNVLPFETFLSYRFDYIKDQILVPFVKAGISAALVKQSGVERPGTQTYYGYDYAAGIELCLNRIDAASARDFDDNVGINNTYLTVEYNKSQFLAEKKAPDLTHEAYRLGLRFEM